MIVLLVGVQRNVTHYEVKVYTNDSDQPVHKETSPTFPPNVFVTSLLPDTEYKIEVNV